MRAERPLSTLATLAELKARGNHALAETREIIHDMRTQAGELRRTAAVMVHGTRFRYFAEDDR